MTRPQKQAMAYLNIFLNVLKYESAYEWESFKN